MTVDAIDVLVARLNRDDNHCERATAHVVVTRWAGQDHTEL
jgi:hypothetical protein